MRKFLTIIVLFLMVSTCCCEGLAVSAQRLKYNSSGIYNGTVIAFGKVIPRPYIVSYGEGKVLINGIIFSPREQQPSMEGEDITVTEMIRKKHDLIKAISKRYAELYSGLGEERAKKNIIEEFKGDSLVKSLGFITEPYLTVEFIDGNGEWIDVGSCAGVSKGRYLTQQEKDEMRKEEVFVIEQFLQNGGAILFGYSYTVYLPEESFKELQKTVKDIGAERYHDDRAVMELKNILGSSAKKIFLDIKHSGFEGFK